jgi:hypothetical protein
MSILDPRLTHRKKEAFLIKPRCINAKLSNSSDESAVIGGAHQRSFHRSLQVDADFREWYQRPFDTVIRGIAVALQGRHVALLGRVEGVGLDGGLQASRQVVRKRNSRCAAAATALFRKTANRRLAATSC